MCNRYRLTRRETPLTITGLGTIEFEFSSRYNIAPTQLAPVVTVESGKLAARDMKWGFKPAWSKGVITNAMVETAPSKPTFKEAFASRRCLVPASGFYEWVDFNHGKQPVLFTLGNEEPFYFGGLWSSKEPPGRFVILTTAANQFVREVHNRMPIIVGAADYNAWLDPNSDNYRRVSPSSEELKTKWVNRRMSNSRNASEADARPLTATASTDAGAFQLPQGLPENSTVNIRSFRQGFFDVEFEGKTFHIPAGCVHRNGW